VADITLSQPERRSYLVPILVALLVLGVAGLLVLRLTPRTTADVTITRVAPFASHIIFKADTIVVGRDQAQDDLYLITTVRITNHLHLPLFLKDFNATFIPGPNTPGEGLPVTTSAVEKADLPNLFTSFPDLGKLASSQTAPLLLRDTRINPNETTEGYVILHFPVTAAAWDQRQDATLTIDLYHQQSLTVALPKSAAPAPAAKP
jgi:hypothetical protein